jgi:hypothetical protein
LAKDAKENIRTDEGGRRGKRKLQNEELHVFLAKCDYYLDDQMKKD